VGWSRVNRTQPHWPPSRNCRQPQFLGSAKRRFFVPACNSQGAYSGFRQAWPKATAQRRAAGFTEAAVGARLGQVGRRRHSHQMAKNPFFAITASQLPALGIHPRQPEPYSQLRHQRLQNLTSGRRSSRLAPKFLIPEVVGLGRAEPIFIAASHSQDVMRSARRDPARGQSPLRMAGYSLRCSRHQAVFNTAPSGTSPCVTNRHRAISSLRASA